MKNIVILIVSFFSISFMYSQEIENLEIHWPEEYKWKVISNQESEQVHMIELIPEKDSPENWSIIGTMMSYKNVKVPNIETIVKLFHESSKAESKKAKLTLLEKDESSKNSWTLFKVETPSFPKDPIPESQLYYAIQGNSSLYVNFVALKEKKLSEDFIKKWSEIFKKSKLVNK